MRNKSSAFKALVGSAKEDRTMTAEFALLNIDPVDVCARTPRDHVGKITHDAQAKSNALGILRCARRNTSTEYSKHPI